MEKEYVIYKGDTFICSGTVEKCASALNVKPQTIMFYTYPCYKKKIKKRKNARNYLIAIKI